ncbi:hypothetical protein [Paraeggerthella hongkongensis]|uniref:Peptidase U32 n=1 Tax=Paraeggerthella hongkongensis TaxID=230658 RepID=A0A3N0BKJ9_9ACTN|nr:hypothetical protein [Paraeggerthella hongkongensis]RNL48972.1 hypothetical protein DMP08_00475 [Paraeggerthella hongkongensis]
MIKYTLPDFTVGLGLNLFFIRLLEQRPDWFQDGVAIDSVYGCFPDCIMNGGRAYVRERASKAQMDEAFSLLSEHGVKPRITFTNMLAKSEHLSDAYFNEILEAGARHGAEAIVYADAVGDYIRANFGMKLVLSTTRAIEDADAVNRMLDRYDYVVLNYNRHKDPAFLAAIEDAARVEVMVNEFCQRNCPHRQEHYLHNSQDQMSGAMRPFECIAQRADFFDHKPGHPVMFTDDEARALHDAYRIEHFKIVGRGVPFATVLEAYAYYLVRPEYREDVKRLVMRAAG